MVIALLKPRVRVQYRRVTNNSFSYNPCRPPLKPQHYHYSTPYLTRLDAFRGFHCKHIHKPFWARFITHLYHLSDRKSTRLNSSHEWISYAVFCLKKKKKNNTK